MTVDSEPLAAAAGDPSASAISPLPSETAAAFLQQARSGTIAAADRLAAWSRFLQPDLEVAHRVYAELLSTHMVDPSAADDPEADHPLAQSDGSKWAKWFQAEELRKEILKDIERLHPGDEFFADLALRADMTEGLFLFAKEHPHLGYRQGMHEIFSFVFLVSTDKAVAYCLFGKIMENCVIRYYRELPNMMELVARFDTDLHQHLFVKLRIEPNFFLLRWLRLLFGREFHPVDVLIVWDALFSDPHLVDYMCLAMLVYLKPQLMASDLNSAMKRLARYPPIESVSAIVKMAVRARDGLPMVGPSEPGAGQAGEATGDDIASPSTAEIASADDRDGGLLGLRGDRSHRDSEVQQSTAVQDDEDEDKDKDDIDEESSSPLVQQGRRLERIIAILQKELNFGSLSEEALLAFAELKHVRDIFLFHIPDPAIASVAAAAAAAAAASMHVRHHSASDKLKG